MSTKWIRVWRGSLLMALSVAVVVAFLQGWEMFGWNPTMWDLINFLNELTTIEKG